MINSIRNFLIVLYVVFATAISTSLPAQENKEATKTATEVPGLVQEKPTKGRFVATPMGYMVPYKVKVPGSDATYELIPVPGGKFKFGSDRREPGHDESEAPQVRVEITPFWIGKTEITWAAFRDYMDLNFVYREAHSFRIRKVTEENEADVITAPSTLYDSMFILSKGGTIEHPAVSMTQFTAKQYTKWLSKISGTFYRLPSSVEWEYACRAGSKTAFSFGDDPADLKDYGWFRENSGGKRHKVAQKKPNAWGLYDMHGNAAEWVLDGTANDEYRWENPRELKTNTSIRWPTGLFGTVARGGTVDANASECRSASNMFSDEEWIELSAEWPSPFWLPSDVGNTIGFRIVRPLQEPSRKNMNRYWNAGNDDLEFHVERLVENEGKGEWGIANRELGKKIKELNRERPQTMKERYKPYTRAAK